MRKVKRFSLVSDGLDPECVKRMKWHTFKSLQQAVDAELKRYGPDAKIGVFTHGASSFPYFAPTART